MSAATADAYSGRNQGQRTEAYVPLLVVGADEGAEDGTAPLRSALFFVFMSSVTFLRPEVTLPPCRQHAGTIFCAIIRSRVECESLL